MCAGMGAFPPRTPFWHVFWGCLACFFGVNLRPVDRNVYVNRERTLEPGHSAPRNTRSFRSGRLAGDVMEVHETTAGSNVQHDGQQSECVHHATSPPKTRETSEWESCHRRPSQRKASAPPLRCSQTRQLAPCQVVPLRAHSMFSARLHQSVSVMVH